MTKASCIKNNKKQAPNSMTQVQTIGGLKRGRGRGRGRGAARGRAGRGGGRSDKPAAFEPFKGSANSLSAQQATGIQQHIHHGSGVFAAEQPHLAGIAKLQQQHDDAIALRAVQLAELQTQEQSQQQQQEPAVLNTSDGPGASSSAPNRPQEASSTDASSVIDLCDDEDTKQPVQQALMSSRPPPKPREQVAWSLGGNRASSSNTASSSSSNVDNPFWCPARYIPAGGENQPDLRLQTREIVQVLDSGLVPHRGKAVLDTGNAGHTLITRRFASQLGLVDMHGNPTQAYSRAIRVQGVVAGAFEMIKTLNITYELKGKRMHIVAGLTEAQMGCDLLISCREIAQFETDGYRFSAQ